MYTWIYLYIMYIRVCVCIHVYLMLFLFLKKEDLKQPTRLLCVCLSRFLLCVWLGGYYSILLVVAQSRLFCGTSVGCVMDFVERCSLGEVKQAQSRALADAMGTSGLVSLRLRIHIHTYARLATPYSGKTKLCVYTHKEHSVLTTERNPCWVSGILHTGKMFHWRTCNINVSSVLPSRSNLKKQWLNCLSAASVFGFYWPNTPCLIKLDHSSSQQSFLSDACSLYCFWNCQDTSFIPYVQLSNFFYDYWFILLRDGVCLCAFHLNLSEKWAIKLSGDQNIRSNYLTLGFPTCVILWEMMWQQL